MTTETKYGWCHVHGRYDPTVDDACPVCVAQGDAAPDGPRPFTHDIHVRRHWPMKNGDEAKWVGGARAVLAVVGYEVNEDGHVCIPDKVAPTVTVPKENIVAITPRKDPV